MRASRPNSDWTDPPTHELDRQHQRAIVTAIDALAADPRLDGVKKLQGGNGEYRIRVGAHRVVHDINDGELIILTLHLGHRKEVYRKH